MMKFQHALTLLAAAALIALGSAGAQAATFTVTNLDNSGPGSLPDAVTLANNSPGPDRIVFQAGLTGTITLLPASPLGIVDELRVTGPGAQLLAVSGGGFSQVFDVFTPNLVVISGLTIKNGVAERGGGLYAQGDVVVNNCHLLTNTAGLNGGAIFNAGGRLRMSNCTFFENAAQNGGAIFTSGGLLQMNNCELERNFVSALGGGILNLSELDLNFCRFIGNQAGPGNAGGALYNGTRRTLLRVRDSVFEGNKASSGGAIHNNAALQVVRCAFSRNSARFGGGINNVGDVTIVACSFAENTASEDGGAYQNSGTLGTSILRLSTFTGNHAGRFGGGVSNFGSLDVLGSTFSGNEAGESGGGISNRQSSASLGMGECALSGNSAPNGGGISNNVNALATLNLCTLFANSAATDGGGINHTGGAMQLVDCTVVGNGAGAAGGGIANRDNLTMLNCTVNGNIASEGGGLLNRSRPRTDSGGLATSAEATLGNSTFSNNRAFIGGGIMNREHMLMTNCTLSGNLAEENEGGGIRNGSGAVLKIGNTLVARSGLGRNSHNEGEGFIVSLGHNLDTDGTLSLLESTDQSGTVATPLDPKLGPLQNNGGPTLTHALLPGSPALDRGHFTLAPATTDQRGFPRIADGNRDGNAVIDIGAYELSFLGPRGDVGPLLGGLLEYSTVQEANTRLPDGTRAFPLTVHYSPLITPQSLRVKINGLDITHLFDPGHPDGAQTILIPLRPGENRLILQVKGRQNGKPLTELDTLGFRVGTPPFGSAVRK
jgi:hypothetical protein